MARCSGRCPCAGRGGGTAGPVRCLPRTCAGGAVQAGPAPEAAGDGGRGAVAAAGAAAGPGGAGGGGWRRPRAICSREWQSSGLTPAAG